MTPSLVPAAVRHAALIDSRLSAAMAELNRLQANGFSPSRIANPADDAKKLSKELTLALGDVWLEAEREAMGWAA